MPMPAAPARRCRLRDSSWTRSLSSTPGRRASSFRSSRSRVRATLTLLIKGQIDGIGTRPRLAGARAGRDRRWSTRRYRTRRGPRRSGGTRDGGRLAARDASDIDADRGWPPRRAWRPGLRPADPGRRRRPRRTSSNTFRSRRCISPTTWRRSARCSRAVRTCRRSRASTPHFIAVTARLPITMPLPEHFYAEGVRRYGFHGLSYEYIAHRLREVAPAIAGGRVIVAHLGSGASMCALANGRSVESTIGLYGARRTADGNAAGPARSRRGALSASTRRE